MSLRQGLEGRGRPTKALEDEVRARASALGKEDKDLKDRFATGGNSDKQPIAFWVAMDVPGELAAIPVASKHCRRR